jgi:hypothetical protein
MADYLDLDLGSLDAEEVRQQGRDYMTAQAPAGWVINPWLDWLLGAVARMSVLVLTLAGQVPRAIFKAFLTDILGIPIAEATAATGNVTVHASATAGGTLPAGAQIDIDGVGFVTTAATPTIAAAGTASVPVQAVITGGDGSGLTGIDVTLIAPTTVWVDAITLNAPTIGGSDGETDDEFVNRGADELPTLSPKAILIEDAAAIARADIEVFRALAIDNLVPPSTTGVAGAITVAIMAADGGNVSGPGKTRVETALEAGRILAIDAHVIDPTQNAMKVSFTATARAGYDPTATAAEAKQAIQDFLSPLGWGVPPGDNGSSWTDEPTVVCNDLFGVLYSVPGIRHVSALTLALSAGTLGTSDVTLTGPAAVPTITSGNITATVT